MNKKLDQYKYIVHRANDEIGKYKNCRYFVLDPKHDKIAIIALAAYADACIKEYPELSQDLKEWINSVKK